MVQQTNYKRSYGIVTNSNLLSLIPIHVRHKIIFEPIERVKSKVHGPNEFKWQMLYYTGRS